MNRTTLRNALFLPFNHVNAKLHGHTFHRLIDLDQLEQFAAGLGQGYVRRMDAGLLALSGALFALAALVIEQWTP